MAIRVLGSSPVSPALFATVSVSTVLSAPSSGGSAPESRLLDRPKYSSADNRPSSGGMLPVSRLVLSERLRSLASLPSSGGIAPVS